MINKLLGILVLLGLGYGVYWIINYYREDFAGKPQALPTATQVDPATAGDAIIPSESLGGLPPQLEAPLKAAYDKGAAMLGNWIKNNRRYVGDPRLGAIELDYAALLSRTDPATAKKIFQGVQKRTPADSPLYARVKKLEAVYR
jgi:hypothetical protein